MKNENAPKTCWRIRGYDSTTEILDQQVAAGQITDTSVKELLRALAAKHLSAGEIIGAYAKRGTKISNRLLEIHEEVQLEKRRPLYSCGHNPHYVATIEETNQQ